MFRVILFTGLLSICAAAFGTPLRAEPVISEEVRHYWIRGETALDLRWDMNAKGPKGRWGIPYDAYTKWQVDWRYRWWETPDSCRITSASTRVRITYTLPSWQNYDDAEAALKSRWDRYYKALYEHEKGHRDLGVRAAQEIENAILNVEPRETCSELSKDADAAAQAVLDRYIQLEKQYDRQTNHGAKTGAMFP